MIRLITALLRRLFGTRILVTAEHIEKGRSLDDNDSPVAIALQEALDSKYGQVFQERPDGLYHFVPVKKIYVNIFRFTLARNTKHDKREIITTPVPKSVYNFLVMYDFDKSECKPFSFRYIL